MECLPPLNQDTLWAILQETLSDETVNALVAHYLGYRYDPTTQGWDVSQVAEAWRTRYPTPPDFIGDRPNSRLQW